MDTLARSAVDTALEGTPRTVWDLQEMCGEVAVVNMGDNGNWTMKEVEQQLRRAKREWSQLIARNEQLRSDAAKWKEIAGIWKRQAKRK